MSAARQAQVVLPHLQAQIDRCDGELAKLRNTHSDPAWAIALAISDWEAEKRLIISEAAK